MKSAFLNLCSVILENPGLDGNIDQDRHRIVGKINQFNHVLKATGDSQFRSLDEDVLLPPVPFASTGSACKLVIVGLNPKFDAGHAAHEKREAGRQWDRYADFYTSPRTFKYVMEERGSRYYANKIKLLHALKTGDVLTMEAIRAYYGSDNEYALFSQLTDHNPVLFAEFIPFHSKNFKTIAKVNKAYESPTLGFQSYIDELMNVIREATDPNGLIIMDGKNPSSLFERLMRAELKELDPATDRKYRIYDWNGKKVLVTDGVLFGMSSPFNRHDYIAEIIQSLRNIYPEFEML